MALSGNYISFQSIIEAVYRRAGYQQIDWNEAVEVIAETIRLIGVLPAYKDITTNGQGDNPVPLEVVDFRTALPANYITGGVARKVLLREEDDGSGGTDLTISSFAPMVESTDLFYQSPRELWNEEIPSGTYDYTELKQVETVTLSGTTGTATITVTGDLTKTVTFATSLTVSASNFVTANAADYLAEGITLTSDKEDLIFTATVSGTKFASPVITNASGDLTGTVVSSADNDPVYVYGHEYKINPEAQYEYKINDGHIYTNFETGYVEFTYKGFVTDTHGFPKIPDDQRYIEAIRWSLMEHIDYKKWRLSEISDKVYNHTQQQRDWYIASARSKANIPSLDKMEALKNMFLRSIQKTNFHDDYFKYANVPEQRYTQNSSIYNSIYYKRRF